MKLEYQNIRAGNYPQTYTCHKCGAYIYVNKIGLSQYFNRDGNQISNPMEEFKLVEK